MLSYERALAFAKRAEPLDTLPLYCLLPSTHCNLTVPCLDRSFSPLSCVERQSTHSFHTSRTLSRMYYKPQAASHRAQSSSNTSKAMDGGDETTAALTQRQTLDILRALRRVRRPPPGPLRPGMPSPQQLAATLNRLSTEVITSRYVPLVDRWPLLQDYTCFAQIDCPSTCPWLPPRDASASLPCVPRDLLFPSPHLRPHHPSPSPLRLLRADVPLGGAAVGPSPAPPEGLSRLGRLPAARGHEA